MPFSFLVELQDGEEIINKQRIFFSESDGKHKTSAAVNDTIVEQFLGVPP